MSHLRPKFVAPTRIADRLHWVRVGLYALVSIGAAICMLQLLTASPSDDAQVAAALGCRSFETVLVLRLQPDGSFRWPQGEVLSLEQTVTQIPVWCGMNDDGVVAVLAPRDAKVSSALPILDAVTASGHHRAILATDAIVAGHR